MSGRTERGSSPSHRASRMERLSGALVAGSPGTPGSPAMAAA
ncbi:hypothetical protein ACMHYB_38640 [Sorangium sp. So ce1128]